VDRREHRDDDDEQVVESVSLSHSSVVGGGVA
jgi:hypothetical protein